MKLHVDDIKKYSTDELLNMILSKFDKLYEDYKYIGISKDKYFSIIKEMTEDYKEKFDNSVDYVTYIKTGIYEYMVEFVSHNFSNEDVLNTLNEYINKNFINNDNYNEAFDNLNKFASFLNIYRFFPLSEIVTKLINDNKNLADALYIVCKKHVKEDQLQLSKISNDYMMIPLIEAYCDINSIEILDEFNTIVDDNNLNDDVATYLNEIGKIPLLTIDEEKELLALASTGDQKAKDRLIESNLRYVANVAKRYTGRGLDYLDLIQEGNYGLVEGLNNYNFSCKNRFLTYAGWYVNKQIIRAIYCHGRSIRIPVHVHKDLNKYNEAVVKLHDRFGRKPTVEEIAREMNETEDKVIEIATLPDAFSINTPVGEEKDSELSEFIAAEDIDMDDGIFKVSLKKAVADTLLTLSEQAQFVLSLRYGFVDGKIYTLEEIGHKMGVSRERVRQIEASALRKLRQPMRRKKLIEYSEDPYGAERAVAFFSERYNEERDSGRPHFKEYQHEYKKYSQSQKVKRKK